MAPPRPTSESRRLGPQLPCAHLGHSRSLFQAELIWQHGNSQELDLARPKKSAFGMAFLTFSIIFIHFHSFSRPQRVRTRSEPEASQCRGLYHSTGLARSCGTDVEAQESSVPPGHWRQPFGAPKSFMSGSRAWPAAKCLEET